MFWWPLTPSAYQNRPVTAAEEWKPPTPPPPPPLLSRQHHSHLGNISLSIINGTFPNLVQSAGPVIHGHHSCGPFPCYGSASQTGGQESQSVLLTCRRAHRLFNRLRSYAWSLHFIKQDKVSSPGRGICFTGIRGTLRR